MVLDDATPESTMDESSSAPTGTIPPNPEFPLPRWASVQVRPNLVVRPDLFIMAFYPGPWQWRRKLNFALNRRLSNMQVITERPPTQDEVDAIVTHTSRRIYHERFGAPLGLGITYASVCRTLHTWEPWRLYYRREGFWVHPVEGCRALWAMALADSTNAAKLMGIVGVRGFFWTLAALTVSTMGASFMETLGLTMDRRLEGFREAARKQQPEETMRKSMEAWKREAAEKAGKTVPESPGERTPEEEEQGQQQQQQLASPSPSSSAGWGSSAPSSSWSQPVAEQSRGSSFFDDDDDASPTAPEYRSAEQGGSAWERIRQQSMSGSPTQGGQRPQAKQDRGSNSWEGSSSSGSGSGPRYSASNPDWGRQREREQSQAEFDRLIEAERNAGNDSWSAGKRW